MATKTVFITTVGTGTFTVPSDFVSIVQIEAIGAGASAAGGIARGGGGGGAYALAAPGGFTAGQTLYYRIGVGGGSTGAGGTGRSWLNTGNLEPRSSTTGVLAEAAAVVPGNGTGGVGGQASASIGTTTFSGGNGGNGIGTTTGASGGGGSAARSTGAGSNGGLGSTIHGGGGGAGAAGNGFPGSSASGGNGGGIGGGAGAAGSVAGNGTAGTGGGGGGGLSAVDGGATIGGNGATGPTTWVQTSDSATAGSGGGGGGAGGGGSNAGGNGGGYGGGAGGGTSAVAAQGIVVFTYTSQSTFPETITESASSTDASFVTALIPESLSETTSASSLIAATARGSARVSETIAAGSVVGASLNVAKAITEAGTAGDSVAAIMLGAVNLAEAAVALASIAYPIPLALTEPGAATDVVTVKYAAFIAETANAAEIISTTMAGTANCSEIATASDSFFIPYFIKGVSEQVFVSDDLDSILYARWDYTPTVISQYTNSPVILQLIDFFSQWVDQDYNINEFYLNMWDIDTAQGNGLDVWGRIVGVSRALNVVTGTQFSFNQQGQNSTLPFGGGPFYSGFQSTTNYTLSDNAFRQLIIAKALSNICNGSIPAINQILMFLFPNIGNCYVVDGGNMTMQYVFGSILTPVQLAIVSQSGIIPRPAGVSATIIQL